jgi:hypothetical protein
MLELRAEDFYRATTRLADLAAYLHSRGPDEESFLHSARELEDVDVRYVKKHLADLAVHFGALATRVTAIAVMEIEVYLSAGAPTWGGVRTRLDEIQHTFRRELRLTKILALDP